VDWELFDIIGVDHYREARTLKPPSHVTTATYVSAAT
jgi:hypothetical protein